MKKYTVSEITKAIKNLIEHTFTNPVMVTGEVSNLSKSPTGHYYFILKDNSSQIKSVFFKRYNLANNGYVIQNGDKVTVYGDISVYEAGGTYQIIVKKIEYDSEGEFYKKFAETKKKLEREGLLDENLKRSVPTFVKRIAVITSPTGAAIKDFISTVKKNTAKFNIDLWPVMVQGNAAASDIEKKVLQAGKRSDVYDVLVLMRGGGSLEDLAVFNEENVARVLRAVDVPTISAIGHQRDTTICDYTADLAVATPTAAAVYLSSGYLQYDKKLNDLQKRLEKDMSYTLTTSMQKLDNYLISMNKNSPHAKLRLYKSEIARFLDKISGIMKRKVADSGRRLDMVEASLKPVNIIHSVKQRREKLEYLENYLLRSMKNKIHYEDGKLRELTGKLEAMSPDKIVSRGYAVVYANGQLAPSIDFVKLDDELEIYMKGGYINAFVTGKKHTGERHG